jgi:thiol-disulfide isomerase/thioredoxin
MTSFPAKVSLAGIALCVGLLALAARSHSATGARAGTEDALAEIPADQWLGGPAGGLSGAGLRGKPVLVEFWTYLCFNCKNVEGWMKETYSTYAPEGLQVIGVHTPEFEVERKVENVRDYVRKNGITWPVAIDNSQKVWRKYNATNAWPAFLVFDQQGKLIYRQAGERAVLGAEEAIRKALDEQPAQSAASGSRSGMTVTTSARRESARSAVLTVAFEPAAGYLLVKSPPNEVRLDPAEGVTTPPGPVLLGEPFRGADAGDVSYFEGAASVRVPLVLDPSLHGRPVTLSGSVVYHVCDAATKVCARQEQAFRVVTRS